MFFEYQHFHVLFTYPLHCQSSANILNQVQKTQSGDSQLISSNTFQPINKPVTKIFQDSILPVKDYFLSANFLLKLFPHIVLITMSTRTSFPFQIIRRNLPNPMGIAIHMSDVYWVDRNLQSIYKASKLQGNNSLPTVVRSNLPRLRDIAIFDVISQPPDDTNPCSRLGILLVII